jgi:hypothetical protein
MFFFQDLLGSFDDAEAVGFMNATGSPLPGYRYVNHICNLLQSRIERQTGAIRPGADQATA